MLFQLRSGHCRYDGKTFSNFTVKDGLTHGFVNEIIEDSEGSLWFGTGYFGRGGGVSRFDAGQFKTLSSKDGLPDDHVTSLLQTADGILWLGTEGGVSRYDSGQFTNYTTRDGLSLDAVRSIMNDRQGRLWIAYGMWTGKIRPGGGATRFDGAQFTTITHEDGLVRDYVGVIHEDSKWNIWIGADGAVFTFDGRSPNSLHEMEKLRHNRVWSIYEDREDVMWFGTEAGVFRYDGDQLANYTTEDGLSHNTVYAIHQDGNGDMWFATEGGVGRYDGDRFTTFNSQDGLGGNRGNCILEDQREVLWFGTSGGGVTLFDGLVFQRLTERDGLADNRVHDIIEDEDGNILMATEGGLCSYRRGDTPPPVRITNVTADRELGPIHRLAISTTQELIAFEFTGVSFKTGRDHMAYVYRLDGREEDWRWTRDRRVVYANLPQGEYEFQVKAVNRDLVYSTAPATVQIAIRPDYRQIGLLSSLGLAIAAAGVASFLGIKRRRERDQAREQLVKELEEELQTARDMQMALMPKESPIIEGLQVAARCIPATQVGGDFFQYFRSEDRLSISTADVTGHAMEAAIPVVMFEGVLSSQMRIGPDLESLFATLNDVMADRLNDRTHVCFSMAQIDIKTRAIRFANAACPYPYHYHAATGDVTELEVDAYPFGIRAGTAYKAIEAQLEPGDRLVFFSDGIVEARNAEGETYGFDQTAEMVRQGFKEGLAAEALLERLLAEVKAFSGDQPQEDDQTIVVVGVES